MTETSQAAALQRGASARRDTARRAGHAGRWLLAARAAFVALAVASIGTCVAAVPDALARFGSICTALDASTCPDGQASPAAARALAGMGISLHSYAVFTVGTMLAATVVYLLVAGLIFWRRSNDWMGLFTATFLLTFGIGANGFIDALAQRQPGTAPMIDTIIAIGNVSIVLFFLIFPSGSFVPRWTVWLVLLWLVQVPGIYSSAAELPVWLSGALFVGVVLVMIGAAIYRYRTVSSALERQQTKWVVLGGVLSVAVDVGVSLTLVGVDANSGTAYSILDVLSNTLYILAPVAIPISIGFAILRYRLFDIDVIIRRTLIYGTLTAILAAVYFAVVLGAQVVGERLAHQAEPPAWLIVITTLGIAALFTPLRRRVQRVIDRRFYRSRYDAARTIESFAATLRSEVDLAALSLHLRGVVEETMQPAHVSLWMRDRAGPLRSQPAQQEVR